LVQSVCYARLHD